MLGFIRPLTVALTFSLLASTAMAQDVLRIKGVGDIKSLDPMESTSAPIRDMSYHIYDTLFAFDADMKVRPQMVDNYEVNADFTHFKFTLREGLVFSDGQPVRSADAIASIKRWASKDVIGQKFIERLDNITSVDDRTFEITLKSTFPRLLESFAKISSYPLFVMPERIALTPVSERIPEYIGSGPFKLVESEWVPGVALVLEKNESYKPRNEPPSGLAGGKVAKVDRIERLVMPDDMSAVNALLAGEVDFVPEFPPQMLPILKADENIKIGKLVDKTVVLVPNHEQPPFNDIKLRHALQASLEQEDYLRTQMGDNADYYQKCGSIFMCGFAYETAAGSETFMSPDPAKVAKLLKEANYDGKPVVYLHPMDIFTQRDMGTLTVNLLRKAGFTVEDVQLDLATFFTRRSSHDAPDAGGWSLLLTALPPDYIANPMTNIMTTGACDKAFFGWPCDKELQGLWEKFLFTSDPAEGKKIAEQMQARAYEIVTVVPMGQYWDLKAWRSEYTGFMDTLVPVFWNVEKAH